MSKIALIVGINKYGEGHNLRGCINDAHSWKNLFLSKGFNEESIRILLDNEATKGGVLNGLDWLTKNRKADDILSFVFSGHGCWTLPPSGNGWECCICCQNCLEDWDDGVISNSELQSVLKRNTRDYIFTIFDSCFSGGMAPSHKPRRRLPNKVRKLLFETSLDNIRSKSLKTIPGPNWENLRTIKRRLKLNRNNILRLISEGKIQSRKARWNLVYYNLKEENSA